MAGHEVLALGTWVRSLPPQPSRRRQQSGRRACTAADPGQHRASAPHGPVAQMEERLSEAQQVTGSIPVGTTRHITMDV